MRYTPYLNSFLLGLFSALIFQAGVCQAAPKNDLYIQQALDRYFPVPTDARSLATGGASSLMCDDSVCTFLNPAGLALLQQKEFSGTIGTGRIGGDEFINDDSIEQTEDNGNLEVAFPIGDLDNGRPEYGTISFAYARYLGSTNDGLNTTPDGHLRTIAYGYAPSDKLALGYTFVFYDDQLHNDVADLHSHARILHIFGTQYELDKDVTAGGVFKLGVGQSDTEDYTKDSNGLSKPRQYTGAFGITQTRGRTKLSVGGDYTYVKSTGDLTIADITPGVVFGGDEEGHFYNLRAGGEHDYDNGWIARAGLRWYDITQYDFHRQDVRSLSGDFNGVGFSIGVGYEFWKNVSSGKGIRIDYGTEYLTALDGEWEHKISLVIPF